MQKIINIFFIVAMLLLATALPLNTAILDFRLFGTHEIGTVDTPIAEMITFSEVVATLKNGETVRYASDAEIPFAKLMLGVDSPRNLEKLVLCFHSNTGKFEAQLPNTTITYQSVTDDTQINKNNITTSDLSASIDQEYREYEVDLTSFYAQIAQNSHGFLVVYVEDQLVARVDAVKRQAMKPLMKYLIDLPVGTKAVRFYFPDESYEFLVPVHRFEPIGVVNYIGLYDALRGGAKPGFGLTGKDAVAMSGDYWVENSAARVEYRSAAIKNFKNPELMYEAVARTFGSYGHLKQTVVNVDRVQAAVIDTSEKVAFYYPVQGKTHTFVAEKRDQTQNAETAATNSQALREYLSKYLKLLSDIAYLPSVLYRADYTIDETKNETKDEKSNQITINLAFEKSEDLPLPEHLEVFLSLTLYSYPGVESVILDGTQLPRIKAFNIEE